MNPLIAKTFGGLALQYYIRQFLFGIAVLAFIFFMELRSPYPLQSGMIALLVLNTLLYPYSRFVYESVIGYIMGQNTFFVNAFAMLFVKVITMLLCWIFAIFVAPIGWAYLYFHHSKSES